MLLQEICNNKFVSLTTNSKLERWGACASAICAVHCVLTGAALGLLSVAGLSFLREPWVELLFLTSTVGLGTWAMRHGWHRHGSRLPAAFFIGGLGLVVAKHFLMGHEDASTMAIWTSLFSAALLTTFFVLNARLPHKSCGCFEHTVCGHSERMKGEG